MEQKIELTNYPVNKPDLGGVLRRAPQVLSISEMERTVGGTPMILLEERGDSQLFAKIEGANPTGSVKARTAFYMVRDYLQSNDRPKNKIVINSGGNFAIAMACLCAAERIELVVSLLESAPEDFVRILESLGAIVVRDSATRDERREITLEYESFGYTFLDQHNSPQALLGIGQTMPAEIWEQTNGTVTDIVAGFGTGMTVFGNAIYFRNRQRPISVTAVEDDLSLLDFHIRSLSVKEAELVERLKFLQQYREETGRIVRIYRKRDGSIGKVVFNVGARAVDDIPGIGISGLQPAASELLQMGLIDRVEQIVPSDAYDKTRRLHGEGIFVGISSGAALVAAQRIFDEKTSRGEPCVIVAIFPDTGQPYNSLLYEK